MTASAQDEVVRLASDLIRIDTTNSGGGQAQERPAAEYVAAALAEAGLDPLILERTRGRGNVVARLEGADPARPALLVHGHLDVVPAEPSDWTVHPFSGEVRDGVLWGRGAVDMKNAVAVAVAVARDLVRSGRRPARDVVFAFTADEEDSAADGAAWLAGKHAELFEGCTEGIGESGAFTFHAAPGVRLYPVGAGERGTAWLTLTARGIAGHGSRPNSRNAVTALAAAVTRIGEYRWPIRLIPTVRAALVGIAEALGVEPGALGAEPGVLGAEPRALGPGTAASALPPATSIPPTSTAPPALSALSVLSAPSVPSAPPASSVPSAPPVTVSSSATSTPAAAADAALVEALVARLGPAVKLVEPVLRNSSNPTMLQAGYKINVIPGTATAHVDGRVLPGCEDEFRAVLNELTGPDVDWEYYLEEVPLESPLDVPLMARMTGALLAEDPGCWVVPYCMAGGTDAKHFSQLGIAGYGFTPLALPPGYDYHAMFHGVDERVPVSALQFGVRVMNRLLTDPS